MGGKMTAVIAVFLTALFLTGCGESTETNLDLNGMDVERYVTLGDYDSISVSVAPAQVDGVQWVEFTMSLYHGGVTAENGAVTDRAVETGDTVIIDYTGKKDGVAFDRGSDTDAELTIGSGSFIPGFEDGLVGVMPGETVELDLTFPEGYGNAELAGQDVVFTVTVKYILPAADEMEDSVVEALGIEDVETVQDLRQYAYDYLMERAEADHGYAIQDAVVEELMSRSEFKELPETFLESYRQIYGESIESIAAGYNLTADEYTRYCFGMDSAEYVAQNALLQAKQEVLLQAIANREGLAVGDEELQTKLEERAAGVGRASVEELLGDYSKENYRNYFMTGKVMDFLLDKTEVTEEKTEEEETAGEESAEEGSAEEKTAGKGSAGEESAGEKSAEEGSAGKGSAEEKTAGKGSAGEKSAGKGSAGEESAGKGSAEEAGEE